MPPSTSTSETEQISALQEHLHQHLQEHLKALESQLVRAQQRQYDQFEGELHALRQQLTTLAQEQQQQQKTSMAASREALEELRKDVIEALHRMTGELDRLTQHTETQVERAVQRLRHEVQTMFQERDQTLVHVDKLGDLFITLGKQLQNATRGKEL